MTQIGTNDTGNYIEVGANQAWGVTTTGNGAFRFEVRPGDTAAFGGGTAQQAEISTNAPIGQGTPFHIGFNLTLENAPSNETSYTVIGELSQPLADGSWAPPILDLDLVGNQLVVYERSTDVSGVSTSRQLYADPVGMAPGQSYDYDIFGVTDPSGNGRVVIQRDGVTLADFSGAFGYTGGGEATWSEGIRRSVDGADNLALTFDKLSIDTSDVTLPDKTSLIASPSLLMDTITANVTQPNSFDVAVHGTAPWRSTVLLYADGHFVGSTTADGTGSFSTSVTVAGGGTHNIYAIADDGSGRAAQSSYPATFDLNEVSDSNIDTSGNHLVVLDGKTYWVQSANRSYSVTSPEEGVVRFEVHSHDVFIWDSNNAHATTRAELWGQDIYKDGTPINVHYGLMIEPGGPNTSSFMVLGQLHQDNGSTTASHNPPLALQLDGENMEIVINGSTLDGQDYTKVLWRDPNPIIRGQYYDIDLKVVIDPTGDNGRVVFTRDGVTLMDYSGALGNPTEVGTYWKEGVYRDFASNEAFAADYKDLTVTTGDTVTFPDRAAFIPMPDFTIAGVAYLDGEFVAQLSGTAKAGTTVNILSSNQVVATAVASEGGTFAQTVTLDGSSEQALTAISIGPDGSQGSLAPYHYVEIGSSASILARLSAINAHAHVAAIILTDGNVFTVNSVTQMKALMTADAAALATVQGGYVFNVVTSSTAASYDKQVETYDSSGTLLERARYAHNTRVMEQVVSGNTSTTTNWNADRSYSVVKIVDGSTSSSQSFTTSGAMTSSTLYFANGGHEIDTYDPLSGLETRSSVYYPDGSRVDINYAVPNQSYAQQSNVTVGGKLVLAGRYDATNRLLVEFDYVKGLTLTNTYDSTNALTSFRVSHSDGTYTVTTLESDAKTVISTGYYTSRGVLTATDTSDPSLQLTPLSSRVLLGATLSPHLYFEAISVGSSSIAATFSGTGQAGSTISFFDGATLLGNVVVDATGHVAFSATSLSPGLHTLSAVAANGNGQVAQSIDTVAVEVGTAEAISTMLPTLSTRADLASIVLTDSHVIKVQDVAQLDTFFGYGSTLAKADAPVLIELRQSVSGKAYDTVVSDYDPYTTLVHFERFSANVMTFSQTFNGAISVSQAATQNGYDINVIVNGANVEKRSYDASDHLVSTTTNYADGERRIDTFAVGSTTASASTFYNPDGSRFEWRYGITSKNYVQQLSDRDASGKIIYVARWDTNGHVTFIDDIATGHSATYTYDAAGTATGYRLLASDGSYTVTTLGEDGLTVTATSFYSAKGLLLGSDLSDPGATALHAIVAATAASAVGAHAEINGNHIGSASSDTLTASPIATLLDGGAGNDILIGASGNDFIIGGAGSDVMTGGGGKDIFWFAAGDFGSTSSSGADRITDFTQGDRIDLASASNSVAGHRGLTFIGAAPFDGHAGEIITFQQGGNTFVAGDLNGDSVADFTIRLDGAHVLHDTDFLL